MRALFLLLIFSGLVGFAVVGSQAISQSDIWNAAAGVSLILYLAKNLWTDVSAFVRRGWRDYTKAITAVDEFNEQRARRRQAKAGRMTFTRSSDTG